MLSLLLSLLLLPPIQGETCHILVQELREEIRKEMEMMEAKFEKKEADLRREVGEVASGVPTAVAKGLRDLPYLILCSHQDLWDEPNSVISYDSFLTNYNNGDRCFHNMTYQQ